MKKAFILLIIGVFVFLNINSVHAEQMDLKYYAKIDVGKTTEEEVISWCGPPDRETIIRTRPWIDKKLTWASDPDAYRKITVILTISNGIVIKKDRLYD